MFRKFSSLIALAGLICLLGATNAAAAGAAKEETLTELFAANLVFVTKGTYDGDDIGGLEGADAICRMSATTAGLGGNFRAWLSVVFSGAEDTETPTTRFNVLPLGPYYMLNGEIVADNFADLLDGTINAPLNVNEDGERIQSDFFVWTGTKASGSADDDCSNWSSADVGVFGLIGLSEAFDSDWTFLQQQTCNQKSRIYCFQQ